MESILIKHINMPQTSRHIRVQHTDAATTGTYTFDIPMPKGAIVDQAIAVVKTAFTNGSIQVGDLNTANSIMASVSMTSAARLASAPAKSMTPVTAFTGTDDGEAEYTVRVTVTTTGANSAGDMYVWVNFRYDPNEVYS
ncbi:MAG: hypothetical protein CL429_00840 [Acidimicrobiaceae bacterium]|nr:hypothetical protein [Acidimicrobiaceae bacterium]|tara:strand:+ start:301 stop:717 length:417 start_codon:yes stop_codon:yes gene_type:complete